MQRVKGAKRQGLYHRVPVLEALPPSRMREGEAPLRTARSLGEVDI